MSMNLTDEMARKMDSDTPRTDNQELAYEAEDGSTYVHTTFARSLEREIRQLEVAIYDFKTTTNELNEAVDSLIEERDAYHDDNMRLLRDQKRLEWLMSMVGWASSRVDIDRMMDNEEDETV